MRSALTAFGRILLAFTRPNRRIARALEELVSLYKLDLQSRGVYYPQPPSKADKVEIMYGAKAPNPQQQGDWD